MKNTNRNARALSQTEKKRAVDVAFTRLHNAETIATDIDTALEQGRIVRGLKTTYHNALNQYWAAGGDKEYRGKLVTKEASK